MTLIVSFGRNLEFRRLPGAGFVSWRLRLEKPVILCQVRSMRLGWHFELWKWLREGGWAELARSVLDACQPNG